jgi:protein-L-isoaspartate O-methyltransferase
MVDLPAALWPAYSLVRPIRLVSERVGLRARHDDSLGPFLSTPDQLVGPLLEVGGVRSDDCVLDIGCGDGRIVVAAAERSGCRAIGVERSDDLVERARRRAADHGVADLVDIVQGDGRTTDVEEATLVVMFLSIRVVAELVPALLRRLRPGARLVIHEQSPLPNSMHPLPDESVALIADGAVTVAHRWTVR